MTGTERKTFQKYYPPDFDPLKIPKGRAPKNKQFVQRVMAPFNLQCNTCGEYTYKGKKFNMRRETAMGEDYLGLRIFRFYMRCPNCLAEITFKTDLENCDYTLEQGATRLFEASKVYRAQVKAEEKQEEEDATNPMKMLEKRTKMSRNEMEALGKLEELQDLNRRQAKVDYANMLARYQREEAEKLVQQEKEDEDFVRSIFGPSSTKKLKVEEDTASTSSSSSSIKREPPSEHSDQKIFDDPFFDPRADGDKPGTSGAVVKSEPSSERSESEAPGRDNESVRVVKRIIEDSDDEDGDEIPNLLKGKTKDQLEDFSRDTVFFARVKKPEEKIQKLTPAISAQKKLLSGLVVVKKKPKPQEEQKDGPDPSSSNERIQIELNKPELSDNKNNSKNPSEGLSLLGGYGTPSGSDSD